MNDMWSDCKTQLAVETLKSMLITDHPQMRVLVRCGHFRSRDKDGDHSIRSAVCKNPMLLILKVEILIILQNSVEHGYSLAEFLHVYNQIV